MSIQRYHFYNIYGTPVLDNKVKDDTGYYVLYADHFAALARVTRERDEAVEALRAYSTGTLPEYGEWKIEGGWRRVIIGIQDHARAVLSKIEGKKS